MALDPSEVLAGIFGCEADDVRHERNFSTEKSVYSIQSQGMFVVLDVEKDGRSKAHISRGQLVGCSWKDTPDEALKGALSGLAEELKEQARLDVERAAKLRKLAGAPQ